MLEGKISRNSAECFAVDVTGAAQTWHGFWSISTCEAIHSIKVERVRNVPPHHKCRACWCQIYRHSSGFDCSLDQHCQIEIIGSKPKFDWSQKDWPRHHLNAHKPWHVFQIHPYRTSVPHIWQPRFMIVVDTATRRLHIQISPSNVKMFLVFEMKVSGTLSCSELVQRGWLNLMFLNFTRTLRNGSVAASARSRSRSRRSFLPSTFYFACYWHIFSFFTQYTEARRLIDWCTNTLNFDILFPSAAENEELKTGVCFNTATGIDHVVNWVGTLKHTK